MASSKPLIVGWILLLPLCVGAELRDPTMPPATADAALTKPQSDDLLRVSAIWISAQSRRAIINGVSAKTGETILNGVKVAQIRRNSVTVIQNGVSKTLHLLQSPYKTK